MTYTVKEIFYTLQGEGARAGRVAVFCRFSGCNLWSGREEDRARAVCQFCDTDFVGTGPDGGKFSSAELLADAIDRCWAPAGERNSRLTTHDSRSLLRPSRIPLAASGFSSPSSSSTKYVVCTGGEPLLQLDEDLIEDLHDRGFEVAVETNGTRAAPASIDWICVSPKAGAPFVQTTGNELKLVYPQPAAPPEKFADLEFEHFFLQPMDGPDLERNTELAIAYCLSNPQWRLSVQTHKLVGVR